MARRMRHDGTGKQAVPYETHKKPQDIRTGKRKASRSSSRIYRQTRDGTSKHEAGIS